MGVLYAFSDFTFFVSYYIIRYRRELVYNNLKRSFQDKNEQELKHIEKNFYKHFCDVIFETIKVLTISKNEIEKRIHIKNLDLINRYYNDRKNIVMYAAHQGNWEWLSFLQLYVPYQGLVVYKPLSSKYFNELMKTIRQRFGAICIEANKSYRTILEYIKSDQLTLTAVIGDQSPAKDGSKCWLNFLNQETAFLRGAARIVERTNQIAVFPAFTRKDRGLYELEFKPLNIKKSRKNDFQLIENYAKVLEEAIFNSPEMWLWSHRRWKLTKSV